MQLRHRLALAATALTLATVTVASPAAAAGPDRIQLRIEGTSKTLFEGPVLSEPRTVRSADETTARTCDGTNAGANPRPGLTPMAVAADGLEISGRTFGGNFTSFEDFFVTRIAGDEPDFSTQGFWEVAVNNVGLSIGGCQRHLRDGDGVVWRVNDSRTILRLDGPDGPGEQSSATETGRPQGRVKSVYVLEPKASITLTVRRQTGAGADGFAPAPGVPVGTVTTARSGDQAVTTTGAPVGDGSGRVRLTPSAGWHRYKAEQPGAVRSNRIDVCVKAGPSDTTCDTAPADTRDRARKGVGPSPVAASVRVTPKRLDRGSLRVRVRCAKAAGTNGCRVGLRVTGRYRTGAGQRMATRTVAQRTVRVKAGRTRTYRLRARAAFRSDLARAGRRTIRVRATTRTDAGTSTRTTTARVRHR
ncbi:MAG: hypothetical protein AB7G37_18695 [Solirubrobacteraceae bacterium]